MKNELNLRKSKGKSTILLGYYLWWATHTFSTQQFTLNYGISNILRNPKSNTNRRYKQWQE
jgi:hypothetical protein